MSAGERPPRPGGYDSEDSDVSAASSVAYARAPVVVRVKRKRAWASAASERLVVAQRPSKRLAEAVLSAELGRKSVLNPERGADDGGGGESDEGHAKRAPPPRVGLGGFETAFLYRSTAYARVCCVPASPRRAGARARAGAGAGAGAGKKGDDAERGEGWLFAQREAALRHQEDSAVAAAAATAAGRGPRRTVLREVGRARAGEAPKRRRLRLPMDADADADADVGGAGRGSRVVDARVVELEMIAEGGEDADADDDEDDAYVYDYYMDVAGEDGLPGGAGAGEGGGGAELVADVAVYDEDLLVLEGELSADEHEYDPWANGEDYDSNDERHARADYPDEDGATTETEGEDGSGSGSSSAYEDGGGRRGGWRARRDDSSDAEFDTYGSD